MRSDFQLTNDDLTISNGDFAIGNSDSQHVKDIVESFPGWWKEFLQMGIGIKSYVGSSGQQQKLKKNINLQLKSDGYTINNLVVNQNMNGKFSVVVNATS